MLHRVNVAAETVLVTGASGGVGSAAVQLAKRRGAIVIAICSHSKATDVKALVADQVIDRGANLLDILGEGTIDVVIDLVAGDNWHTLLKVLRRGGRYATAGAFAGPISEIDIRTLYLKDLTLFGCRFQEDEVFENLIGYIERGEIRPVVAKSYPLSKIAQAQEDFLAKKHTGKLVLIPPKVAI
jgi:NADPH:quinone reductase-like Zn-dependent oxidoreductase